MKFRVGRMMYAVSDKHSIEVDPVYTPSHIWPMLFESGEVARGHAFVPLSFNGSAVSISYSLGLSFLKGYRCLKFCIS